MSTNLQTRLATGKTVYAQITRNSDGAVCVISGPTFEQPVNGHWTTYALSASDAASIGLYAATLPAIAAGKYTIAWFVQVGGSPAITDGPPAASSPLDWSGSGGEISLGAMTPGYLPPVVVSQDSFQESVNNTDIASHSPERGPGWTPQGVGLFFITTIPRGILKYTGVQTGDNCILSSSLGTGNHGCSLDFNFNGWNVSRITVLNGGHGYTAAPTAALTAAPAGGVTATAVPFLNGAPVASVTITAGGSSYTAAPTVSFSGGGGSSAAGTAVISGGAVTSVTITNGGSGYIAAPIVSFSGGGGSNAAGTAVLTVSTIVSITITNGGTGYTAAPTVSFSGGGGSSAAGTAVISGGAVTSVTITNAGSGYTSNPSVSFSGGGGSNAAATAVRSGAVGGLTITNGGAGYTSTPGIAFTNTGTGGTSATATAAMNQNDIALLVRVSGTGLGQTGYMAVLNESTNALELRNFFTLAVVATTAVTINYSAWYTLDAFAQGNTVTAMLRTPGQPPVTITATDNLYQSNGYVGFAVGDVNGLASANEQFRRWRAYALPPAPAWIASAVVPGIDINGQMQVDVEDIAGVQSKGTPGYTGIDWSTVNSPTSVVGLTNTTIGTVTNVTNITNAPSWAPPLCLARETFSHGYGEIIDGRPIESGANNYYGWDSDGGIFVQSGVAINTNLNVAYASFNLGVADQIRIRALVNVNGDTTANDVGISFRCSNTGVVSGYIAVINAKTGNLELYSTNSSGTPALVSGGSSSLRGSGGAFNSASYHWITITLNGTSITVTQDGVIDSATAQISYSSATSQGNTWVGLTFGLINGTPQASPCRVAYFEVTTLGPTTYNWPVTWAAPILWPAAIADAVLTDTQAANLGVSGSLGFLVGNAPSWYTAPTVPPTAQQNASAVWQDLTTGSDFSFANGIGQFLVSHLSTATISLTSNLIGSTLTIMKDTDMLAQDGLQIDLPGQAGVDISGGTAFTLNFDEGKLVITGSYVNVGGVQKGRFQPTAAQTKLLKAGILHNWAATVTLASPTRTIPLVPGYGVAQVVSRQDGT